MNRRELGGGGGDEVDVGLSGLDEVDYGDIVDGLAVLVDEEVEGNAVLPTSSAPAAPPGASFPPSTRRRSLAATPSMLPPPALLDLRPARLQAHPVCHLRRLQKSILVILTSLCIQFSSLSKDNGNWNPHALGNGERNGVDTIE
ncbi:hypothetical protein RHGRI_000897 [Rhododendron griersonianum]|uniref:Uncharacterized protein n=1 Tax=Rhododendron griersonianum TaxID=479676 RepID=A0AAV6LKI4_9ERIC|nr:hypothetical protein RHGRI_000897 [Rhododendron griersonianum]